MRDRSDHPAHRRVVGQYDCASKLTQTQLCSCELVRLRTVDAAANESDLQLRCHDLPRCQDIFEALATKSRHGLAAGKTLERIDRSVNDIVRIGCPDALGKDVLHTCDLQDRTNRAAGDDTGSGTRRTQNDGSRPEPHKLTAAKLGLGKLGRTVILPDNPAVRGMIRSISHLVKVEAAE